MKTKQSTRVLIVEDEIIAAKAIERSLASMGYEVVGIASSGGEAVRKVEETQPDVVLMDIKIKGPVDGVFTTQRVQTQFDIPVIYLTAMSDDETLKRILHSKPYGYIVKPFRDAELYATIEGALGRHELRKKHPDGEA